MTLRKPAKIAIAIATILPVIYMVFFFGFVFLSMLTTFHDKTPNKDIFDFMPVLFIIHFGMMLIMVGLLVFYMVYLFRTERVSQDKKVLWAIVLFMGSFIAMPIFWYLYIWREPTTGAAGQAV